MYQLFSRDSRFDNSPFQYARMDYLRSRVDENYKKLVDARRIMTGRMESNHLLYTLLLSLTVEFKGNLQEYIQAVGVAEKRVIPGLGITSSYSRGRLFTDGVFYADTPEIIISAPSYDWTVMDLWKDYRKLSAVTVLNHEVTDLTVIELGVMNPPSFSKPMDLAIIAIDVPLLAAQWQLWRVGNPDGTPEHFITEVPLAGMIRSHLNIAFFNKVQMLMGIRSAVKVKSNLPFAQNDPEGAALEIAKKVVENITTKTMDDNVILSSIPVIYGTNYLDSAAFPAMAQTYQMGWAEQASKMDAAAVVLEAGRRLGYEQMLDTIRILRRTLIQNEQNKTLTNGLTTATAMMLIDRMANMVVSRLPTA